MKWGGVHAKLLTKVSSALPELGPLRPGTRVHFYHTWADRPTQITHLRRHHPDRKLLMYAYWRPTITPYLPKYIPVQQRRAEGGRSHNQEGIGEVVAVQGGSHRKTLQQSQKRRYPKEGQWENWRTNGGPVTLHCVPEEATYEGISWAPLRRPPVGGRLPVITQRDYVVEWLWKFFAIIELLERSVLIGLLESILQ
jgi:hypothetical protein